MVAPQMCRVSVDARVSGAALARHEVQGRRAQPGPGSKAMKIGQSIEVRSSVEGWVTGPARSEILPAE